MGLPPWGFKSGHAGVRVESLSAIHILPNVSRPLLPPFIMPISSFYYYAFMFDVLV